MHSIFAFLYAKGVKLKIIFNSADDRKKLKIIENTPSIIMDSIKEILRIHFSGFEVRDISNSYYGKNVLQYDSELQSDKRKLFLVEKNLKNSLFVVAMSQSVNPFLILQDDNYLSLALQDVSDASSLLNRLKRFLQEKNFENPCCKCMKTCQNYALCDNCSVVLCYTCVSVLQENLKFKCPQCQILNPIEIFKQ